MLISIHRDRFTAARAPRGGQGQTDATEMAYQTVPADSDRAVTRSATLGYQKPTTAHERHELAIAARCRFLLTLTCRELFDREHDRGELACGECLNHRYYLPGARVKGRWSKEELEGFLVGNATGRGYSRELVPRHVVVGGRAEVLPPLEDKAGTRNTSCKRLHRSAEQFAILESLRQRTEMVYWQKVQRGEGN